MAKGKKTGGRKAGTPNKFTQTAKEAFEYAFTAIGGRARLAEWAGQNPDKFFMLYAKLIPTSLEGTGEFTLRVKYAERNEPGD